MKRLLLLLGVLSLLVPTHAQNVRNKPFDPTLKEKGYTTDEIIGLFGKPDQIDDDLIDGAVGYIYPKVEFFFVETYDPGHPEREPVLAWDGFMTESPDFCILSDSFPGGIKVGDSLERLRQLDFVHTKRGKGRVKNGLRPVNDDSSTGQYVIFQEEYDRFYLDVKDGIVSKIQCGTPVDWERFEGGLLWKIYGDSLAAPSYVLGTFPNAPAGFYSRIKGLDQALKEVKAVYREDPETGPWSRKITDKMYLPRGTTLESLYEWEEWVDIRAYVKQVTGFRPETLEWSPDGLTRYLLSYLLEQALPELAGTEEDLAAYLCRKAREQGKEVHPFAFPFRDVRVFDKDDPKAIRQNDWNLLRLVWYPEGKPDHVKERIRHLYDAWQAQDLEEFSYSLMEEESYSPLETNLLCNLDYGPVEELRKAVEEGPVLILVDCTELNRLLLDISWGPVGVKSMRP